jgi:hypothetical protein
MTGELRVDPSQIQYSAAGIRETAQNLAGTVQNFHGQVQGLVQQPGNDMISPLIWSAHSAVLTAALRCFASNTSALHGHAAKLDATAAGYRAAEHDNVTAIDKIGGSL